MTASTLESPARPSLPAGLPETKHPATGTTEADSSRPPIAFASIYAPCPGRSWWHLAYICPRCGHGHLGRARDEASISGPRKARCGRLVVLIPARVYRGGR
jgi:hypothetical protein